MADEQIIAAAEEDKGVFTERLDETIYMALEPLKVAIDRLYWHHQNDQEMQESFMILERLVAVAESRLNAFDEGVWEHLGIVGLKTKKMRFLGMDAREYVGGEFIPKTQETEHV